MDDDCIIFMIDNDDRILYMKDMYRLAYVFCAQRFYTGHLIGRWVMLKDQSLRHRPILPQNGSESK